MLRIENISVYYKDVQALRDVALEVPEKKIVALLGPNAAGKSTTLRTISGMVRLSRRMRGARERAKRNFCLRSGKKPEFQLSPGKLQER